MTRAHHKADGASARGARRHTSVSYALYDGGHDWQLWHAHLNQMLVLASHDVSEPPRRGSGKGTALTPCVLPIPNGAGHASTAAIALASAG